MRTATTIVTVETGAEVERSERKQYTLAELKELDDDRGYHRALETLVQWALEYDWCETTLDSEVDHIAEKYGITYDPKKVSFDLDRGSMFTFGPASVDERVFLKRAGLDLRRKDARTIIDHGLVMGTHRSGFGGDRGWIGLYQYEDIPDWTCSAESADAIRDVLCEAQDEMLTTLRDEQEYLTSEPALLEMAEANEYRFHEDGTVAP